MGSIMKPKIVFSCRICGKKIETSRSETGELEGPFMADDAMWSELLDHVVYNPLQIVCNICVMTRGNFQ
jgi:hypothetical protein